MKQEELGHKRLIGDLKELLREAEAYQFHDFKNTIHEMPKRALVEVLVKLAERARDGGYDD